MCTNTKEIRIKGSRHTMRVNCGVCPSCLVEKSNRNKALLSAHTYSDDTVALFCTLHYRNSCIPYVYVDDIRTRNVITVYRDCNTYRFAYRNSDGTVIKKQRFVYGLCELGEFLNTSYVAPYNHYFLQGRWYTDQGKG